MCSSALIKQYSRKKQPVENFGFFCHELANIIREVFKFRHKCREQNERTRLMTAKSVGRTKSKLALTISSQQNIAQNELSADEKPVVLL